MKSLAALLMLISPMAFASTSLNNAAVYYATSGTIPAQQLTLQAQPNTTYQTVVSPNTNKVYVLVPSSQVSTTPAATTYEQVPTQKAYIITRPQQQAQVISQPIQNQNAVTYKTSTTITPQPQNQVYYTQPIQAPQQQQVVMQAPVVEQVNPLSIANGFRIGLSKGGYEGDVDVNAPYEDQSFDGGIDHDYSIYLGYISASIKQVGFDVGYTHSEFAEDLSSDKIDGNMTFGFSPITYGRLGINVSRLDGFKGDFKSGIGYQIGVGVQPSRHFGMTITYIETNNEWEYSIFDSDVKIRGVELAFTGTF